VIFRHAAETERLSHELALDRGPAAEKNALRSRSRSMISTAASTALAISNHVHSPPTRQEFTRGESVKATITGAAFMLARLFYDACEVASKCPQLVGRQAQS
jgi:hypothetical protein